MICWLQVSQKVILFCEGGIRVCDLGVSDSMSSHSYPFFSAYIVVWYFLLEVACYVVYFSCSCRSPNSVPFFSFRFGR